MQVQPTPAGLAPVTTLEARVSGGEVAVTIYGNGRRVCWMNGHRVDASVIRRKRGMI